MNSEKWVRPAVSESTKSVAYVALLMLVAGSLSGCGFFSDEPDESSAEESALVEDGVLSEMTVGVDSEVELSRGFEALDPMQLVNFNNAYTIELGRFSSEEEARAAALEATLEHSEMGIACQAEQTGLYYLLGYGLFLDETEAQQRAEQLRQMLPVQSTDVLVRLLSEVQLFAEQSKCLSEAP